MMIAILLTIYAVIAVFAEGPNICKQVMKSAGGGGYSHILAIWVSTAGKGMIFKPFGLV